MIDTHVISMAMAGVGIAAGAAILLATLIMVVAAIRQHEISERSRGLAAAASEGSAGAVRTARVTAQAQFRTPEPTAHEPTAHEPALR